MKDYINSCKNKCLRSTSFTPFNENNETIPPSSIGHLCCSYCAESCECEISNCQKKYLHEKLPDVFDSQSDVVKENIRTVNEDQIILVKDLLNECMSSLSLPDEALLFVPSSYVSGLTQDIIFFNYFKFTIY